MQHADETRDFIKHHYRHFNSAALIDAAEGYRTISDSTTGYGSYSGAVPNEKITWEKVSIDTPTYLIESDTTIVAPLVFA